MTYARHAEPGDQATSRTRARRSAGTNRAAALASAGFSPGAGLCVLVLLLGELAKAGPVARWDLRADEHIAAHDPPAAAR